jgi:predicted Zn-dependent protease
MSYRIDDVRSQHIYSSYGCLDSSSCPSHSRSLHVEMRVGSPQVDNTHNLRGGGWFSGGSLTRDFDFLSGAPIDDDVDAIRVALWKKTDTTFKEAQDKFTRLTANKAIKVEEEDKSADFSSEKPVVHVEQKQPELEGDRAAWTQKLERLSAIFKDHPHIDTSSVNLTSQVKTRYYLNSEGTKIQDHWTDYRIDIRANAIADDGMEVELYDYAEAPSLAELPDEAQLTEMVNKLAKNVDTLRTAPVAEPYTGPAILRARAAAVYFHEIMGHRLEAHRLKDEGEGRTFAKKIGQRVLPDIISLVDDPTTDHIGTKKLAGTYKYDDEGVPAQKVQLVDHGVLKGFLMSRSPVDGFDKSNGHGRAHEGESVVARQGNLMVQPSQRVSYDRLRELLIEEIKKQNKPYGLIFDEISGGFTMTTVHLPQVFELKPLSVTRVYADGRPDELLRGVNLIGTPLASLETITAAADDDDTFNGMCGAESGYVPVAAVSPSLLVREIEVERQGKGQEKAPILPPPPVQEVKSTGDTVMTAMEDELARSTGMQIPGNDKPFMVEYTTRDSDAFHLSASFGAVNNESCSHSRSLATEVLLGNYKVNSARGSFGFADNPIMRMFSVFSGSRLGGAPLTIDDDLFALRRDIWKDTDDKYKSAIEHFAAKKAFLASNEQVDRPDDFSPADPVVSIAPLGKFSIDQQKWTDTMRSASAIFKKYPNIQKSLIGIASGLENRWFLNSEGSKNRCARPKTMMMVLATADRDDGSKIGDCAVVMTDTPDQLPAPPDVQTLTVSLADRVDQLRAAKAAEEDYDGPVLMEGEAAAQFLSDTLVPQLGNSGDERGFSSSKNQWREKLNTKVLPSFVSIIDDPMVKEIGGVPVYGQREIDDDGVRAQKLTLVDHGILKTFCLSRVPTRQLKQTNGHSLGGVGVPTNVIFAVDGAVSKAALKERLIAEGKEQGLKYVYIFRRMNNALSALMSGNFTAIAGGGDLTAMPPLEAYRVYTDDGHEELVRDLYFAHLTMRALRDIEAAADDLKPYTVVGMGVSNTFAAPSILIKEIELQKRQGKPTKNEPILPNPYFEKASSK